jgi:hypothetical protein
VNLRLRVEVATADAETTFIQITDVLSTGTGETSSIPDAINVDPTLGGVVQSATVLNAEWPAAFDGRGNVAWFRCESSPRRQGPPHEALHRHTHAHVIR